jgi:hypothetical protein
VARCSATASPCGAHTGRGGGGGGGGGILHGVRDTVHKHSLRQGKHRIVGLAGTWLLLRSVQKLTDMRYGNKRSNAFSHGGTRHPPGPGRADCSSIQQYHNIRTRCRCRYCCCHRCCSPPACCKPLCLTCSRTKKRLPYLDCSSVQKGRLNLASTLSPMKGTLRMLGELGSTCGSTAHSTA